MITIQGPTNLYSISKSIHVFIRDSIAESKLLGYISQDYKISDCDIIYAMDEEEPIAYILFANYDDTDEFWLLFGYCAVEWRRCGPYRMLIDKLKEVAKDAGYTKIYTSAKPNNEVSIKSIEARGAWINAIQYCFNVE